LIPDLVSDVTTANTIAINTKAPIANPTFTGNVTIPDFISHTGDSNTFFGFSAADTFEVTTAGTERFRIDASGNVGIGTSSPSKLLHLKSADSNLIIQDSTSIGASITGSVEWWDSLDALVAELGFRSTDNTNFTLSNNLGDLVLDSEGAVVIAPASNFVNITGTTNDNLFSGINIYANWNNSSADKPAGQINFYGNDVDVTGGAAVFASINAVTTTWTSDANIGGSITLNTTATGGIPAERMRIDENGNVGIGLSSPDSKLKVAESFSVFGSANDQWAQTSAGLFINSNVIGTDPISVISTRLDNSAM
jgi:hypothetical protein